MKLKEKTAGKFWRAAAGGLAGAVAVTLIHESMRQVVPDAPRMDVLGMRALAKGLAKTDQPVPDRQELRNWTLAGDIVANSVYYSLVGSGKHAWSRGALLGLAAGIGGVVLPGPLGLGEGPSNRTPQTQAMTIAWYLMGGLAAAATVKLLAAAAKSK